ncbi:MAG: substrate binding domain-containing protein, partial [Amphritea sp.]|nr:substrate binding domain-containing protein [Amphritea sp.]
MIPGFLKRYPHISIDLVMDDKNVDLVREGFDIAIRGGELADSSLVARRLAPLKSVLCASPAYLQLHGQPERLDDLVNHNCLSFSYSSDVREWRFSKEGVSQSVMVSGNYQVNNSEALRDAVLQDLGIARLPTFVAGEDIRAGRLVRLFPDYEMPVSAINAVLIERQFMPAKVRVFLDFAIQYFGSDHPYWDR